MTEHPEGVTVSGPATPDTVRVFRAVAGSLAMRAGATVEGIDEFRIAVDEAATLLAHAGTPVTLEMKVEPAPGGAVGVTLNADEPIASWPGDREGSWSWRVITHVATGARLGTTDRGCPQVSFVMRPSGTD
jgi:hypothetical protein